MTTEDELIFLWIIEGMLGTSHKHKILGRLQIINMNIEASMEFLRLELIKEFIQKKDYNIYNTTMFVVKYRYCGKEDGRNKNECPALGKNMFKQQKERSFSGGKQL